MPVSRRTFLSTVAAGSAATALPVFAARAEAASSPGDVVGKIGGGYQGWFACPGDGAPIGGWWHWSRDRFQPPSASNTTIVSWPDMRGLSNGCPTAYPNLGNGQSARLFSSSDQQTVDVHFGWMRTHNVDTAAPQRFNPVSDEGPTRDAMTQKVRAAAEATGRKFSIMDDVTGWTNMPSELKTDWTSKMAAQANSPAYPRQNGKPVVCVWGFGFGASPSAGRAFNPAATIALTPVTARYVRLTVNRNTGWPAAQISGFEVYGGDAPPVPPTVSDLARGKPASASSTTQSDGAGSAVDGNQGSYWESANSAFPQRIQIDLGASTSVGRLILGLPTGWERRTKALTITGSTTGSAFTTLSGWPGGPSTRDRQTR